MDAFERYVRAGLELAGVDVDDVDLMVMRGADAVYGPGLRALTEADLAASWPEPDLDPAHAPPGSPTPRALANRPALEFDLDASEVAQHAAAPAQRMHAGGHPQDLPLREQAALVASGELDPRELLAATVERIAERDGPLNSVVEAFAEQAERMLESAPRGALHGVPVATKDQFSLPWRGPRDGTPHEQLPPSESGVFRRLRDAGALVVAATNMHYGGGGTTGHLSAHGPCGNPWDVERCGGGSSGGSAAAVGARLVAGAIGADGGGSVRVPAAYCGITGLKPTFGSVPTDGNVHGYLSMDVAGPFARDAADLRLLSSALLARPLVAGDASGLRVGVVRSPFWEDVDPDAAAACRAALDATGWQVEEIELEGTEHVAVATVLQVAMPAVPALRIEELAAADPITRGLAKFQLLLPAHTLPRADRVRALVRRSLARAFERVDLVAWPTVPAAAPRIDNPTVSLPSGETPADPPNIRHAGVGNLTGVPGVSTPVGLDRTGMPLGLMLQGPWGEDGVVIDAAEHVERATSREFVDAIPPIAAAATR